MLFRAQNGFTKNNFCLAGLLRFFDEITQRLVADKQVKQVILTSARSLIQ